MYMALMMLVVLLVAVLALSMGPNLSQNVNHTFLPGANHKLDSFYHHVLLIDKRYSTYFLPW